MTENIRTITKSIERTIDQLKCDERNRKNQQIIEEAKQILLGHKREAQTGDNSITIEEAIEEIWAKLERIEDKLDRVLENQGDGYSFTEQVLNASKRAKKDGKHEE